MFWNWKKIIGIILMVISVVLLVITIQSVADNLAKEGPAAGKINSFKPQYQNQGVVIILTGIASAITFLVGIAIFSIGRKR